MNYQVDFEIASFIKNEIVLSQKRIRTIPQALEVDGFSFYGIKSMTEQIFEILRQAHQSQKKIRFEFSKFKNSQVHQKGYLSFPNVKADLVFVDQLESTDLTVYDITEAEHPIRLWPLEQVGIDKNTRLAQAEKATSQFNERLKKINTLFDTQANHYTEPIKFEGLYQLLTQKANQLKLVKNKLTNWTQLLKKP